MKDLHLKPANKQAVVEAFILESITTNYLL